MTIPVDARDEAAESDEAAAGGAPVLERETAAVNGFRLPDALLVPEEWCPGFFVRVELVELSWFAAVPVAEAVAACRAATGVEPRSRRVVDRYFDTPDRALYRRRISVRLRHYVHPPRNVAYEVIAVGWGGPEAGGRRVHGFVQTFAENTADDLPRIVERYRSGGFEEVACFDKTRHAFEVLPTVSVDAHGMPLVAPDRTGVAGARDFIRSLDFGIKVDVDDLRESPFPEPSIVEVEYDPGREAGAAPIVAHLRAALAGRLRPKELNKIAYVLGGSSSPADPHHPESPQ